MNKEMVIEIFYIQDLAKKNVPYPCIEFRYMDKVMRIDTTCVNIHTLIDLAHFILGYVLYQDEHLWDEE